MVGDVRESQEDGRRGSLHVGEKGESMNGWLLTLYDDPSDRDPQGGGACAPRRASSARVGFASGLDGPGQSPPRMYRAVGSSFEVIACMSWE